MGCYAMLRDICSEVRSLSTPYQQLQLASLLLLASCFIPAGPEFFRRTGPFPQSLLEGRWFSHSIPPIPEIEEGQDLPAFDPGPGTELHLADMIDFALRFNPLTKLTWAAARSAALKWSTRRRPIIPRLSITQTFSYQDIGQVGLGYT